jgi:hypothetical protein
MGQVVKRVGTGWGKPKGEEGTEGRTEGQVKGNRQQISTEKRKRRAIRVAPQRKTTGG